MEVKVEMGAEWTILRSPSSGYGGLCELDQLKSIESDLPVIAGFFFFFLNSDLSCLS